MSRKPVIPNRREPKFFIGIGFLTALMLFLFWPVVKFLASFLMG